MSETICGQCERVIVLREHKGPRGPWSHWVHFKPAVGTFFSSVGEPSHYITDADGIVTGEQSHYPQGTDPTPIDEW